MYQAVLFDLDGTLTESGEGITRSVQYALEKLGLPAPGLEELEVFIGPPLLEQFQQYAHLDRETAELAVQYYRERYSSIGIYENRPYDGVEQMLSELKEKGYRLGVASSKPEKFVRIILEHFHLSHYFEEIVGSEMGGQRTDKTEVIEEALSRMKLSSQKEKVLMVGDKEHDVYGARKAGLQCVAAAYGYGTEEELKNAGPLKVISSPEELLDFFG